MNRLRWALADGWTITMRDLVHWARQPWVLVVGLLFPVLMVLMFGYLLGGSMTIPGGGGYREFLMPGMFALTMVFGIESTYIAISEDISKGVTDRFRSMPMSRPADVTTFLSGSKLSVSFSIRAGPLPLACHNPGRWTEPERGRTLQGGGWRHRRSLPASPHAVGRRLHRTTRSRSPAHAGSASRWSSEPSWRP